MLWRAIRMGAQGFYTARAAERRVCERLRARGLLEFKDGRRSRLIQFFTVTEAGRSAFAAAGQEKQDG
jgi:DNA-binding MarR family transcriptional regulator